MSHKETKQRIVRYWFADSPQYIKEQKRIDSIAQHGAQILNQCQHIMSLTNDQYCKDQLTKIIHNTTQMLELAASSHNKPLDEQKLQNACKELQENLLAIPQTIQTPLDFATVNYKLMLIAMYAVVISVSLALGFAFGAAYWGLLTVGLFVDHLVTYLTFLGIPALSFGLFSFGMYTAYKDPVNAQFDKLVTSVDLFCSELNELPSELPDDFVSDDGEKTTHDELLPQ